MVNLRKTTWRPDVCDCILEYEFDLDLPDTERVHTVTKVTKCNVHKNIENPQDVYDTIVNNECAPKSHAFYEILNNLPVQYIDIDPESGQRVLKKSLGFRFQIEGTPPNRTFIIYFDGVTLTQNQRTNLQTRLDNRFGVGKVTLG